MTDSLFATTGGSATNTVLGPFAYTVGGNGGSGGNAGTPGTTQVSVLNQGIVSTSVVVRDRVRTDIARKWSEAETGKLVEAISEPSGGDRR